MRRLIALLGTLLMAGGLLGLLLVVLAASPLGGLLETAGGPASPVAHVKPPPGTPTRPDTARPGPELGAPAAAGAGPDSPMPTAAALPPTARPATPEPGEPVAAAAPEPGPEPDLEADGWRPISRVVLASIGLDAEVVPSRVIWKDGVLTWDVPAFKAGHADGTAGAGQPGNALLLGHVTSVRAGDVFRNLERARVGDGLRVFSRGREFHYRVVDIRAVPRDDESVVDATPTTPTITLVTCTGVWNPFIWDYTEREVVRAELVVDGPPTADAVADAAPIA